MKHIKGNTVLIIVLPIILGFLAGVWGYSLFLNNGSLPYFGQIDLADNTRDQQIVIDQPRNVIVRQDVQLRQIENDLMPAMVNIYYAKNASQTLNQVYLASESLGGGFVLTADGWVVTTKKVMDNPNFKYSAVGYQGKEYTLSQLVEDKITGLVFSKVEADNLPVVTLGKSSKLGIGQTVAILSKRNNLTLANIKKIGYVFKNRSDIVQSSESLNKEIFVDIELGQDDNGAVVANLKGEVVGVVNGGKIILADQFQRIVGQVLEKQEISRPTLGARYIDLAQVEGLSELGDRGALIYGTVPRTNSAYNKLLDGDIVKKVDDSEINAYWSLSELINDYRPGDYIEVLVDRDGEEIMLDIELK